jgi:hypothetical protein
LYCFWTVVYCFGIFGMISSLYCSSFFSLCKQEARVKKIEPIVTTQLPGLSRTTMRMLPPYCIVSSFPNALIGSRVFNYLGPDSGIQRTWNHYVSDSYATFDIRNKAMIVFAHGSADYLQQVVSRLAGDMGTAYRDRSTGRSVLSQMALFGYQVTRQPFVFGGNTCHNIIGTWAIPSGPALSVLTTTR